MELGGRGGFLRPFRGTLGFFLESRMKEAFWAPFFFQNGGVFFPLNKPGRAGDLEVELGSKFGPPWWGPVWGIYIVGGPEFPTFFFLFLLLFFPPCCNKRIYYLWRGPPKARGGE